MRRPFFRPVIELVKASLPDLLQENSVMCGDDAMRRPFAMLDPRATHGVAPALLIPEMLSS